MPTAKALTPDQKWRVKMVHQRRALRMLGRQLIERDLRISELSAKNREAWLIRAALERRLRWQFMTRWFGWQFSVWKGGNGGWLARWRSRKGQRRSALLKALRSYGYHSGGCAKFDADNRFDERRNCTCGLTAAMGSSPDRCRCRTCRQKRDAAHQRLMQPVDVPLPLAAVGRLTAHEAVIPTREKDS